MVVGPASRKAVAGEQRREPERSPTRSSRRSSSACSTSRWSAGGRSQRPSGRRVFRWRSCPTPRRGRCGRTRTRSVRSCGSTRILQRRRGVPASRRSNHARSRWPASSATSRDSGSRLRTRRWSMCRRAPRRRLTSLMARVHGDPEMARQAILERLTAIDPNMARGVATLRTLARMDTIFLQFGFWVTMVLGGLALVLTLSGLFSVLSYVVAQRTREIGVRMALGATTRDVARMVAAAVDAAGRRWSVDRRRIGRRRGRTAARHACCRQHRRHRPRARSRRLRREPRDHHRRLSRPRRRSRPLALPASIRP